MKHLKTLWTKIKSKKEKLVMPIQTTLTVSFTLVTVLCMCVAAFTLYKWFANHYNEKSIKDSEILLNQAADYMDTYLTSMRRISDGMYYSVIKDVDLNSQLLNEEMGLIYEINKDNLVSIACFTNSGDLVAASPVSVMKDNANVSRQNWFNQALYKVENLHFSSPHVSNVFDDTGHGYRWVVSLSRAVELTNQGKTSFGVLLVDMNYSSIKQLLEDNNKGNSGEYMFLLDENGEIIYHPKQQLIYSGIYNENYKEIANKSDGSYEMKYAGNDCYVSVKTVSYTGWKLVYVSALNEFSLDSSETRYFFALMIALFILMIYLLNLLVSSQIAKPLKKLNKSVEDWESGNLEPRIYVGGSNEVQHLGMTLKKTAVQLQNLMDEIVMEQEEKRKSELDALQSQINPHFLYNTLDSIVWMIEGEKYEEAVFMITQLASLFRISLSKGKTIISIRDEIQHVKNYMSIQKVRYKNKFTVEYNIDEKIYDYCTVKLIIQPLLENAIYYGMEYMDGDGEIKINGYMKEDGIYIEVVDNGLGMSPEVMKQIFKEGNHVPKRGSGVGLINVQNRIKLRFGQEYGLEIESEPDEGTTIRVHLPAILYSAEVVEELEGRKKMTNHGGAQDEK